MPGTWVEARSAKVERLRREARFYTPDLLGKPCPVCKAPVPVALNVAGIRLHPTCGPPELVAGGASSSPRVAGPLAT